MDAPIVAISILSPNQLIAAQNMIVCARKQENNICTDRQCTILSVQFNDATNGPTGSKNSVMHSVHIIDKQGSHFELHTR